MCTVDKIISFVLVGTLAFLLGLLFIAGHQETIQHCRVRQAVLESRGINGLTPRDIYWMSDADYITLLQEASH